MKKGDIVTVRGSHIVSRLMNASKDMQSWNYIRNVKSADIPKELTIKQVTPKQYCGGIDDGLEFEEIPGSYAHRCFEIALKADEPDIDQLMEETMVNQETEVVSLQRK